MSSSQNEDRPRRRQKPATKEGKMKWAKRKADGLKNITSHMVTCVSAIAMFKLFGKETRGRW